ncbi:maleylpyruvate isomerase family mycothiol-dependent enzyme [Actinoplanes sp. NPDC051633]|uniref:maleylpyruvate isomerase family mycothiol-dependent enzyme n=1 Tax=Actinoplanes sp. NPDC051633 TaxID=3155670 RepID=UPI00342C0EB9
MREGHHLYRSWLADEGRALAATLGADPATPVPSCPGWTIRDLVAHVGSYHRWAADLLRDTSRLPRAPYSLEPDPGASLADWYEACLELLLEAIDITDPETPMWTVTVDQRAGAWCRRQAHDLTVHRWDAQHALGRAQPVDPERAIDFIDELFEATLPFTLPFLGRRVPPQSLGLRSADDAYYRRVEGNAGRPHLSRDPGQADATLTGTPSDLLLTLWRRTGTATLAGNPAALTAWQQAIDG